MGYEKVPSLERLQKEYNANIAQLEKLNKSYSSDKAEIQTLSSLKKNIDQFLEKDVSRVKTKTKEELD